MNYKQTQEVNKMKNPKKLLAAVLVLCMLFCFAGCGSTDNNDNNSDQAIVVEKDKFIPLQVASFYDSEHKITYTYLKDEITEVMYLCMQEDSNLGGFDGTSGLTAMLDPETGGPLLYDKWLDYVNQNKADNN